MNASVANTAAEAELQAWFTVARNTYAIIDGQAVPQIETLLEGAGAAEWSRLAPGAAPADSSGEAWCVQLTPELALSRWLLAGEGRSLEDWGVLVFSDAPFRQLRQHVRGLLEAQLARGERVSLRWYRPPVLRALLPLCTLPQLNEFFGPIRAFALADPNGWTWLRLGSAALDQQSVALVPSATASARQG